ncbi:MAG: molybdopterin biosynthesis protein [Deltaproteobacteria bacterium]|nr:molybdopterin biosynthesis protein [Deltaproteobacteria bacterium]
MTHQRNIYLKMTSLENARELMFARFAAPSPPATETVPVTDAVGRVLSAPVFARLSSPNFHSAAMDGIAVQAEQTFGTSETNPRQLQIGQNAFYVNTGHVLPANTNAVIMIEQVNARGDDQVEIEAPAFPWQHVRRMGEDIVATELLFPRRHVVTPYCVGALISGGIFEVTVHTRPRVLIIPTGSELVDWRTAAADDLRPGQVLESNSFVLGQLVEAAGGVFERYGIIIDDPDTIRQAVDQAVRGDFDIVLTIGGSSAGSEDYAKRVVSELGEILVHGVTIMPGKPLLVGDVGGKPVFGIPGYPVSAIIAFEQFVRPLLRRFIDQADIQPETLLVETARKIPSKLGTEEFLRVKLGRVGDRVVAAPLPRGAGCITTITEADGILRIPCNVEGLREGEQVRAELIRASDTIDKTLMIVGSHDNSLDILADEIRRGVADITLSSSHVGSMGGLMAIKRGVCHLAGSHLLDTADGSYNSSYIRQYLPNEDIRLVHLVMRDQGLIVPRGNPKKIGGIEDLVRDDVRFINRQGGAGTRILLDFRLKELGIDPAAIAGYTDEEFTHMAVAVAVLSGTADVGLGIQAAARALDLDFIPVVTEQYDLVIPGRFYNESGIQVLLETIRTDRFKQRVEALGGYHTEETGKILSV